ncbi:hypothetical protein [Neorhizobium galegae]|uniref:hypothetical protein n=1 Tax=Neorhizobium galegae TaxID=399 RepID=UPI000622A0BC|nr:hypothetical protein [Neorhizobium galegae]KAB1125563.1 hypothetical protein F4V90_00075 [Neorhizobium galegae]MCQ1805822.1 hypothetical protein [Neorhizobium galegae]CDZ59614.1 Hypothetical protein NGAL_HAMBI2566_35960 [Neorhizobium galegae bv. orientalis]
MKPRTNTPLPLVGFLDAGDAPAFLIPVFADDSARYLQDVDAHDTVTSFGLLPPDVADRVTERGDRRIYDDYSRGLGHETLYAFQTNAHEVWLGSRDELKPRIERQLKAQEFDPFTQLELLEFIGAPLSLLRNAILKARLTLLRSGVPQADAWTRSQFAQFGLPIPSNLEIPSDMERNGQDASLVLLPLIYTSTAEELKSMMQRRCLFRSNSASIGRDIVSLLYGRPNYQLRAGRLGSALEDVAIALVIDGTAIPDPYQVYPFNTTEFPSVGPRAADDFEARTAAIRLSPTLEAAAQFVDDYYEDTRSYVRGEMPLRRTHPDVSLPKAILGAMLDYGPGVEIILDRDVDLTPRSVQAIIVPHQLANAADIAEFATLMAIDLLTYRYPQSDREGPRALGKTLEDYLDRRGLLSDARDEFAASEEQ